MVANTAERETQGKILSGKELFETARESFDECRNTLLEVDEFHEQLIDWFMGRKRLERYETGTVRSAGFSQGDYKYIVEALDSNSSNRLVITRYLPGADLSQEIRVVRDQIDIIGVEVQKDEEDTSNLNRLNAVEYYDHPGGFPRRQYRNTGVAVEKVGEFIKRMSGDIEEE